MITSDAGGRGVNTEERHDRTFWDSGRALYLDLGGDYMNVHTQNL